MNFFLSKVYAQVDGMASPTIPFTAPGNVTPTISGPTSPVLGPGISMSSNVTNLNIGDRATIQIIIDTQLKPINRYAIQILYSPAHLRVVDFDDSTDAIEVDFRDTFFDATINEVSQQQGIITISAENPVGSSSITNRVVAQFEVEALQAGFVEMNFGEENTMLLDSSSVDLLQSTNSLEFVIGGGGAPTSPVVITTSPGASIQPTSEIPLPSKTPDTALGDNLRAPITLITGMFLIIVGGYLYTLRKPNANKES